MNTGTKVLFVNLRLTAGGSEKVMAALASAFAEQGIQTEMLLLKDEEHSYSVSPSVKLIDCFCPMRGNKIVWHIKRILSIRRAIKQSKANTVVSFMWDVNMHVLLACLGLKKRVVVSERADPSHEARQRAFRFASKWILPLADVTVFQTPMVQKMYPSSVQKRSVVIPNPISNDIPQPFSGDRKKMVVAAGRFSKQKNFEMLIKSFAAFSGRFPDYNLCIFGDGSLREEYKMLAERLGIADKLILPGYVNDVDEQMKDASIYVSSSNYEGISNSMLEAMAMGLPCVCTDCPVGGAAMVIDNHVNGILVPVDGVDEMTSALIHIAESQEFAEKLSKNACRIRERFSMKIILEQWRAIC